MANLTIFYRPWWHILLPISTSILLYHFLSPFIPSGLLSFPPAPDPKLHCYRTVKTLSDALPDANCFAVYDGKFVNVFPAEETAELVENGLNTNEEADGGWGSDSNIRYTDSHVIPGLWDGHGHLIQYGEFLHSVDLFGTTSTDQLKEKVGEYVSRHPDRGTKERWIRGVGWDQMALGRMPTAQDLELDPKLQGLYIMVDRVDVHCTLVSQAVLDLLPETIPDVPGGEVVREPGMGVFCDNAMDMVYDFWPRPDRDERAEFVRSGMKELNKVGIVGMHDAGINPEQTRLYKRMYESDDWTVRVYAMAECSEGHNRFCPEEVEKIGFEDTEHRLALQSVKLFADGALGSWGSAMLEPYTDRPHTSGTLLVDAEALTNITTSWALAGFQVNIHAIGDLANRLSIDALEAALKLVCSEMPPPECQKLCKFRIEHAQIIHPDDQKRIHALGLIPSIQPTHATSDMKYAAERLGEKRTREEAYRMRSFLNMGLEPVLGSDFPVEPPDVFEGIYAAVARKSPSNGKGAGRTEEGWYVEEAIGMEDALVGFTRSPGRAAFLGEGTKTGVIERGALADWVVLDEVFGGDGIEGLRGLRVRETWVGGRMVYQRGEGEE